MDWAVTKNNRALPLKKIPEIDIMKLRDGIVAKSSQGMRVVLFFPFRKEKTTLLYAVLADDENSRLLVTSADIGSVKKYPSLTPQVPALHLFERELFEETGIVPEGHPWLKQVRYAANRSDRTETITNYPFFKMEGDQVHEVAVGPIHAGVIEPGHFRFMCQGEDVYHLEIQLGYQHRGVERLFTKRRKKTAVHLAESIAGDTVIGHASAYAGIMESLCGIEISRRSQSIRAIALELERTAIHIGDMGAIANDVAYLIGNAVFGATRTLAINTTLAICGNRFGRSLVREGGVIYDISGPLSKEIREKLKKISGDVMLMGETMFNSASVLSRLDHTGIVGADTAREIGLVGPAARASGVSLDVRTDHPFGIYRYFPVHKRVLSSGDVFARTYIRYMEVQQSVDFIMEQLENLPSDKPLLMEMKKPQAGCLAVSMTEGWRGEIVHAAITGRGGEIERYKVKDPSFNNWYGLALAVRDNGISDFPLCNKSFNLSYSGHDL